MPNSVILLLQIIIKKKIANDERGRGHWMCAIIRFILDYEQTLIHKLL